MLNELEEMGELDTAIVVVTSDNGMPFPRQRPDEQDFHLPLAICWKNGAEGGRVVDDLVSFTDYAPTFLKPPAFQPIRKWSDEACFVS